MCIRDSVLICHEWQTDIVDTNGFSIIEVMQHHSLRFSGSAGGIKYIGKVIVRSTYHTFFHDIVIRQILTHCQKFIKINGSLVTRVTNHRTIKDDKLLQRLAETEHTESSIVLKL